MLAWSEESGKNPTKGGGKSKEISVGKADSRAKIHMDLKNVEWSSFVSLWDAKNDFFEFEFSKVSTSKVGVIKAVLRAVTETSPQPRVQWTFAAGRPHPSPKPTEKNQKPLKKQRKCRKKVNAQNI